MKRIDLDIRYYHRPRTAGISEADIRHKTLRRSLEPSEVALVLVDVWSDHHIATHLQRGRNITLQYIKPIMDAFRGIGAAVVHAPGSDCAPKYPEWLHDADDVATRDGQKDEQQDWPPRDFTHRTGAYQDLVRPLEQGHQEVSRISGDRRIIQEVEPRGDDFLVETGDQLHHLLRERKILHLFYAGFAANICVPFKSYGTRAMKDRGYEIILVRDCTTAIETGDTIANEDITKNAIRDTELNIGYTTSSSELIAACELAGSARD